MPSGCRTKSPGSELVDLRVLRGVPPCTFIERQKEKYGWEFLFLGANIDAAREAARFGITEDCSANYHADRQGTAVIFNAMSEAVCSARSARPLRADWKRSVEDDYKKRGGK